MRNHANPFGVSHARLNTILRAIGRDAAAWALRLARLVGGHDMKASDAYIDADLMFDQSEFSLDLLDEDGEKGGGDDE